MKTLKKNSMLPMEESNDPNNILVKDKKFLTIAMLITLIFMAILALTLFIVGIVEGNASVVFVGLFSAVISVSLTMIFVCIAHNISRQTVAVLKIAEKMLGKPAIDDKELAESKKESADTKEKSKENSAVKGVSNAPRLENLPKSVSASMQKDVNKSDNAMSN